jgi:O-antigen ligase
MPLTRSVYQQQDPLLAGAFYLLLIILFSVFSAVFEILPVIHALRPVLVLSTLGLLVVFATGQFAKVLTTPIGISIMAFTAWFIACIPFGLWPGGSFKVFTDMWYKAVLVFVMTAGLVTTLPQAKLLFRTIAYATGLVALYAILRNQLSVGRLGIRDTRYQNANEFAWSLLVGLTFIGFLYIRGTRIQRYVAIVLGLIVLLAIAKTGSRGGFLGVVVLAIAVFIRASVATRIKLAVGGTGLLAVLMVLLPNQILQRFTTWSGDLNPYELHSLKYATVSSTEARLMLLKDSLRVTAAHPFLGVGPGNFAVAQDALAQERGQLGNWQVTHNSFTEVSCEMGLPGLAIYLVFLYQVFKQLNSILRVKTRSPVWTELRMMAMTLQAAMIAFLVTAISTSLEFNTDVPVLAGITVAVGFLARKQRAIDRAAELEPVILPPEEVSLEPALAGQY